MHSVIEEWFAPFTQKPQEDKKETAYKKSYAYFAMGAVLDGLSFFHNISQHLVCLDQLENLPNILSQLIDEREGKESTELKTIDEKYWDKRLTKFNKKILQHERDTGETTKQWFEKLLTNSDFVSYISAVLNDNKPTDEPAFITDPDLKEFIFILIFLVSFIERHILSVQISSPTPFYLLARQNPAFKLWVILWLYQNSSSIKKDIAFLIDNPTETPNSRSLGGLPWWRVKCLHSHKANNKTFVSIVGPYIQQGENSNYKNEDFANAFKRLSDDDHCQRISYQIPRPKSDDSLINALSQRIHHTESENHKRLFEFKQAWTVFAEISWETDNSTLPSMSIHELIQLAVAICWLARYRSYLWDEKALYQFPLTPKLKSSYISKAEFHKTPSQYFTLTVTRQNKSDFQTTLKCTSNSLQSVLPNFNSEKPQDHERWMLTPTEIENRILARRLNLYSNVTEQISHVLKRATGNYFDFNPSTKEKEENSSNKVINFSVIRACNAVCSLLCRSTGADSVQLYVVNHTDSQQNLLGTLGIFSRDPKWLIPEIITDHLNKARHKKLRSGEEKGLPKSFVIRAIVKGEPVFVDHLEDINSHLTNDYGLCKPRSGIAIPLLIHGRILGVLQIKGMQVNQFEKRWMSIFTQTADSLAPFIYQLRLANILSLLQQQLAQDIDFHHPSNMLNEVASQLCEILLIDQTFLLFRNGSKFTEFPIRGYDKYRGIPKPLRERISALKINILSQNAENNHFLSDFPGLSKGTDTLYIDKNHRFDYLHGSYNEQSDEMTIKQYPYSHRQKGKGHKPYKIKSFLSKQPESFSQIFKADPAQLGFVETLIFPLASPPPEEDDWTPTLSTEAKNKCRLLGFVVANNKVHRSFGDNWENIIRLLAQVISVGVGHSDQLFTRRTESDRILRHEIKAYNGAIKDALTSTQKDISWLKHNIEQNRKEKNQEVSNRIFGNISSILDNLIPDLNQQLESLKHTPLLQRLGIDQTQETTYISVTEELRRNIGFVRSSKNVQGLQFDTSKLHHNFEADMPTAALRHIFNNILTNIVKYSSKKRVVEIYSSPDHGHSIIFENIFCPDEVDDKKDKKQQDSEGVGLFIVRFLCDFYLDTKPEIQYNQQTMIGGRRYYTFRVELNFSRISR